jgi:hypothetical protein
MLSRDLTRFIAAGAAAIVVALGVYAIVSASSGNGVASSANAATLAQSNQSPRIGHAGQSAPNQRVVGQIPKGWHSGSGTIITGAAANKAKSVALAQYPGGTVNRVLKLSDGSYAVHMIKISWPHHVFVSKNFKVTGAIG